MKVILLTLTFTLLMLVPLALIVYAVYFLVSLPLRRQERARILIDLLELQCDSGTASLSDGIVKLSHTEDPALGVRFHIFAAHLERGLSFKEASQRVPRLLPPTVQSILSTGETIGNLSRVLPACQGVLNDAANTVHAATRNYLLLLFVLIPTSLFLTLFHVVVWPKFLFMITELSGTPSSELPALVQFTSNHLTTMGKGLGLAAMALIACSIAYVGGTRLRRWMEMGSDLLLDRIVWVTPWRRSRIQRNFSMLLAILLDEGVPETEAIQLAAKASNNQIFIQRAHKSRKTLEQGGSLNEALQSLDPSAELSWRLKLAARHGEGFRAALRGWWEWLDARAARQEQVAAQAISTGLVLTNGLVTGLIAYSIFYGITHILDQAILW